MVDKRLDQLDAAVTLTGMTFYGVLGGADKEVPISLFDATYIGGALGSTDNALVRADGTGGRTAQGSSAVLEDNGQMTLTATADAIRLFCENASAQTGTMIMSRSRPSPSPAVVTNDVLGGINARGHNGTAATIGRAVFSFKAAEAWSSTANGTRFAIELTPNGSTSRAEVFTIENDGSVLVGAPTGGAKGVGTINAKAVYDDNTLLTCYPFDAYLDGKIDEAKWDNLVPDTIVPAVFEEVLIPLLGEDGEPVLDKAGEPVLHELQVKTEAARTDPRRHEEMRKFRKRIGTDYDPLTLDGYAKHWREKRHLTSMPNEQKFDPEAGLPTGAWIQRLVETVEIQAILIEKLNQRLKAAGI